MAAQLYLKNVMPKESELDRRKKASSIFAFTVSGGSPHVTELADNPEGHAQLANLIRAEQVIGLVYGEKMTYSVDSVVTIGVGGKKPVVDKLAMGSEVDNG